MCKDYLSSLMLTHFHSKTGIEGQKELGKRY